MKVFISWSGTDSKSHILASAFHEWLPNVFQTITTFMSSDTLVAGERWQGNLSKVLEDCDFGIACLTPKSYHADWILFECGALAKKVDIGRVIPVLCDVTGQMMSGHPLTMFNYVSLDEKGVRRLVEAINLNLKEHTLSKEKVEAAFKKWWPDFQELLKNVEGAADEEPAEKFKLEPAIEEILSLLRSLSRRTTPRTLSGWPPAGVTDTGGLYDNLLQSIGPTPYRYALSPDQYNYLTAGLPREAILRAIEKEVGSSEKVEPAAAQEKEAAAEDPKADKKKPPPK